MSVNLARIDCDTGEVIVATVPSPPVPVPQSVTRCQAKLALLGAGLLASAETALGALPEPQRTAALIYWNDAATFERDHWLITAMGAALTITEQQIDDLFRAALAY